PSAHAADRDFHTVRWSELPRPRGGGRRRRSFTQRSRCSGLKLRHRYGRGSSRASSRRSTHAHLVGGSQDGSATSGSLIALTRAQSRRRARQPPSLLSCSYAAACPLPLGGTGIPLALAQAPQRLLTFSGSSTRPSSMLW